MRSIYLPNLKKIEISNFTLYPNGLQFEYNFINGVNVIIGGNGMGKTTFVNLIKYSIIGHYKKEYDYTRTYKDRKIEKRTQHQPDYYRNRLNTSIVTIKKPTVTIHFDINNKSFTVERCIEDITLNSFSINNKKIDGHIISQSKYEDLSEDEKVEYLQKKYEIEIEKYSGLPFDDLIFFVNEILYFGEDHKTILWNDGTNGADVQNELFNKYFNSPELDKERKEADRQAKYFDSSARHRSEDIRAINKVLKKVNEKSENSESGQSLNARILKAKKSIQVLELQIESNKIKRVKIENKILLLNNQINELSLTESNLDKRKKTSENKLFENKWIHLHKNYDIYLKSIKLNHICPLCSKQVESKFIDDKIRLSNSCLLCAQEINVIDNKDLSKEFSEINDELINVHTKIQNFQKEINNYDNELLELDILSKKQFSNKRNLQSELREFEYSNSNKPNGENDNLQAFYDEIDSLETLKADFEEKSRLERSKADNFSRLINEQISKETIKFSVLFSEFAEEFLGVKCSLTYDDNGDGNKRFYPIIDGKGRYNEEELSESQRFFIDHSFRMRILSFFHTKPTFYIIETPDSSLDISYEKNAANVFLKFLQKDNTLILTTNLNNSAFLNHLIELSKDKISIISLFEIGKKSVIQTASTAMSEVFRKIKLKLR